MKYFSVIAGLVCLVALPSLLINGCKKSDVFYGTPLTFEVPPNFPQPAFDFQNNPATKEGFNLGRKLFYE